MTTLLVGFFSGWAVFAVVLALHLVLPARRVEGYARNEHKGSLLHYRLNGLPVFAVSAALWFALGYSGIMPWDWLWQHRWSGAIGACALGISAAAAVVLTAPGRGGAHCWRSTTWAGVRIRRYSTAASTPKCICTWPAPRCCN